MLQEKAENKSRVNDGNQPLIQPPPAAQPVL